jgi:DNA polymerase (family X)
MEQNREIAGALEDLADALLARGELFFKVRSYRKAAAAIRALEVPLAEYRLHHDLQEIPGVGEAIATKVTGMLELGPREWLDAYLARRDASQPG